jgi:hypothetical protein
MGTSQTTNPPTGLPIPAMIAVVAGEVSDQAVMMAEETRIQTGAGSSAAGRTQARDLMPVATIPRMIMGNRVSMTMTMRARNMALHRPIRLMIRGRRAVCARRHDVGQTRDPGIRRMMAGRGGHPPTLHAAAVATRVAIVGEAPTGQMV